MNQATRLLERINAAGIRITVENTTEPSLRGVIVPAKRIWMRGPSVSRYWEPIRMHRAAVIEALESGGSFENDLIGQPDVPTVKPPRANDATLQKLSKKGSYGSIKGSR